VARRCDGIQPVYPFRLSEDWNLISRSIVPVIWQQDVLPGTEQTGLGDIPQSFFLSPNSSGGDGLIWGAGLAMGLPTATEDVLGTGKWTAAPTAAALRMDGPFTYGALRMRCCRRHCRRSMLPLGGPGRSRPRTRSLKPAVR